MSDKSDVIWLSASPSLRWADQPLLRHLVQFCPILQWEYAQSLDEASSLDEAVSLLHGYLMSRGASDQQTVHLVGHGISGVLGLLYARRFPQYVRSLTLLSVAAQPAATWHTHYYVQRQLLPYSRHRMLAQTVSHLFETIPSHSVRSVVRALERDLEESPNGHSLFRLVNLAKGGVAVPLMVGGSYTDAVAGPDALCEWQSYLKDSDVMWMYPKGRHFFHYYHPTAVGDRIYSFWQDAEQRAIAPPVETLTSIQHLPLS